MVFSNIMVIRYLVVILLGISIITLLLLLNSKNREFYARAFIVMSVSILLFLASDFLFLRLPKMSSSFDMVLDWSKIACITDVFYYVLIVTWIIILSRLTGRGTIIPEKVLITIMMVYATVVEGTFHFINSIEFMFALPYVMNAVIVIYAVYYLIFSIKHFNTYKPKGFALFLSVVLLVYIIFVAFGDIMVHNAIKIGVEPEIPYNPMVEIMIIVEIITIIYFWKMDPLDIMADDNSAMINIPEGAHLQQIATECGLTPREFEVLEKIIEGDTTPQIAKKLYLSESTVKKHLSSIFMKTGTANRHELIILVCKR